MMDAKAVVEAGFEKALVAQEPVARANVARLRRLHPDMSPQELITFINRTYLGAITATGAAAGAAGALPGAAIPTALVDVMAFTEASVLYVLSLADIHGLDADDIERRKLLVMTVLIGDGAAAALNKAVGRTGPYWARRIVTSIPMSAINAVNGVLGTRFVTKYGAKQGVLVLSKQAPFGIGAALGGGGNHLVGRGVVASARKIFGPAPEGWVSVDIDSSTTDTLRARVTDNVEGD